MVTAIRLCRVFPPPEMYATERPWTFPRVAVQFAYAAMLLVAGVSSSLMGCTADAIYITQQPACVRVTLADSGKLAGDVNITFEERYHKGWISQLDEAERNDYWFSCVGMNDPVITNNEGLAQLTVNIGMIRGGLFPEPFDPHKDRLTGLTYLFRIRRGDVVEILSVAMVPGHVSCGRFFKVTILSIGPSKEVTQKYFAARERRKGS